MASLSVVRPGLQTTVQDGGRWGWQASGVSVSGAMDRYSYRLANVLVGNADGAAALEVTIVGPEVEFADTRLVAVVGAEFVVTLDGQRIPTGTAVAARAGSRLAFGDRTSGARAYLAIAGGIDVPLVFGSRSTHLVSRIGGLAGRALASGDVLPLGKSSTGSLETPIAALSRGLLSAARIWQVPSTSPDPTVVLRVLDDGHVDRFADEALAALQSAPYVVGQQSDRVGFRLEGPILRQTRGADILSDVTPMGTLQVPASGQPILLMADRQTTGGYTRIGTVISADLPSAGQLAPGDRVRFEVCGPDTARAVLAEQEARFQALVRMARA
jgi:antagonist of KipI